MNTCGSFFILWVCFCMWLYKSLVTICSQNLTSKCKRLKIWVNTLSKSNNLYGSVLIFISLKIIKICSSTLLIFFYLCITSPDPLFKAHRHVSIQILTSEPWFLKNFSSNFLKSLQWNATFIKHFLSACSLKVLW